MKLNTIAYWWLYFIIGSDNGLALDSLETIKWMNAFLNVFSLMKMFEFVWKFHCADQYIVYMGPAPED